MLPPQEEPKILGIRKGFFMGAIAVGVIILFIIIINMINTFHEIKNPTPKKSSAASDTLTYATPEDVAWVAKSKPVPIPPPTPVASVSQVNSAAMSNNTVETQANTTSVSPEPSAPTFTPDELKAIAAPIDSNQLKPDDNDDRPASTTSDATPNTGGDDSHAQSDNTPDPNGQAAKKAFIKFNSTASQDYLSSTLEAPASPYEVKATTIIPGVLVSGINSDLPGPISGQVTENVYDSRSGQNILIPQGAKLLGLYDSQVAFGQERVLVVWQRIIFPNGQSIDLQGMPGVDISGLAGFNDQVNNHYGKLFSSVLLISVLSAGAQLSQPQQQFNNNSNGQLSINQMLAQSLGTNISNAGTNLFQKDLDIQPTLQIRQGYQFNIMVTKDLVFPSAYTGG